MGNPVFIAGCGRSGTSYLRTIVDAHPRVFIPSESLFIIDYLRYGSRVPKGLLKWLFFHEPQLRCWYSGKSFDIDSMPEAIARVHQTEAQKHGAVIWGQKTPRFVNHMDLIESAFPGTRWILIYRDPRGVAASMKRSGQHTSSVRQACRRWLRDNRAVLEIKKGISTPDNVLLVKYEELVTDYDAMLRTLFGFLSLEPLTREDVSRLGKPVFFDRSRFTINTVRGNMDPDPGIIHRWKDILSGDEVSFIESTCSGEMKILGYEPCMDAGPAAGTISTAGRLKDLMIPLRYLAKWPEYIFFTALRYILLRYLPVLRRGSRNSRNGKS